MTEIIVINKRLRVGVHCKGYSATGRFMGLHRHTVAKMLRDGWYESSEWVLCFGGDMKALPRGRSING